MAYQILVDPIPLTAKYCKVSGNLSVDAPLMHIKRFFRESKSVGRGYQNEEILDPGFTQWGP